MNVKPGALCIFKNGEEAIVERIIYEVGFLHICLNKEVTGWIGEDEKNSRWDYRENRVFITEQSNGNDIMKVVYP